MGRLGPSGWKGGPGLGHRGTQHPCELWATSITESPFKLCNIDVPIQTVQHNNHTPKSVNGSSRNSTESVQ